MDHFQRVIRLLLWFTVGFFFGGFLVLGSASAAVPQSEVWKGTDSGYTDLSGSSAANLAPLLCGRMFPYPDGISPYYNLRFPPQNAVDVTSPLATPTSPTAGKCWLNRRSSSSALWGDIADAWYSSPKMQRYYQCPSNSTLNGSSCVCNAGFVESGGQCVTACASKAGSTLSSGYYDWGPNPDTLAYVSVCDGSCYATFDGRMVGRYLKLGIYQYVFGGSYIYDGSSCSNPSTVPSIGSVPPDSCNPATQYQGQVNGKTVCINKTTGKPDSPYANTPTTTTTGKTTTTGADGSTTTTETSNNPDGSSTTKTTVTDPSGNQQTTETKTPAKDADPMEDYCKKNPSAAICKASDLCKDNPDIAACKKSAWGGACASGFSCDGDAVQCAIAREQHIRNCALFDTATDLSTLGAAVASGNDPQSGQLPSPATATAFDVQARFQQAQGSSWLGRGYLPNVSIATHLGTHSFDTTLLSQFLAAIGYVFVAVAGVVGVRIVGTGGS